MYLCVFAFISHAYTMRRHEDLKLRIHTFVTTMCLLENYHLLMVSVGHNRISCASSKFVTRAFINTL